MAPPVQAYACGNAVATHTPTKCVELCAYASHAYLEHFSKFPDFFETQCWQP